ncbi:MAG TPA: hypothetical protein VEU32_17145 [Burkholderiales bacterium]|nr:hypothetical protein [Burkholderiales bacterium]
MKRIPNSPLVGRALEVAEKHLGIEELSKRLNAPVETIRVWGVGHATMPEYKFLRLIDVLTELPIPWEEWNP